MTKRIPKQIESDGKKVLAFIKKHPSCNAEDISKGIKMPNNMIALPIRRLLAQKAIKCKGQARGVRYTAR